MSEKEKGTLESIASIGVDHRRVVDERAAEAVDKLAGVQGTPEQAAKIARIGEERKGPTSEDVHKLAAVQGTEDEATKAIGEIGCWQP
ncbi:MAG: hypothetical protein OEY94_03320 [Alphaproteobacteria bacterium]|nr:hypothetical protein [Alphaproteobacteria bacterium]